MVTSAAALVALTSLVSVVAIDPSPLGPPGATRRGRLAPIVQELLDAGHALSPPGLGADVQLVVGPSGARGLVVWDAADGDAMGRWQVVTAGPSLTPAARRAIRARVGVPSDRAGRPPSVDLQVRATDADLEARLRAESAVALLDLGVAVTRRRAPQDPRVCVVVSEREARLSRAAPGQTCERVSGRIADPLALGDAVLLEDIAGAVAKLGREAMDDATGASRAGGDERDTVMEGLFRKSKAQEIPAGVAAGRGLGFELGWRSFIPDRVSVGGGMGLLARPPKIDPGFVLDLRTHLPWGLGAGVWVLGDYAGHSELPVLELTGGVGIVYEHRPGWGFASRLGVYGGGRVHTWGLSPVNVAIDPMVAVVASTSYEVVPGLLVDITVPIMGSTAHAHPLPTGRVWRRTELGIALMIGAAYDFGLPW